MKYLKNTGMTFGMTAFFTLSSLLGQGPPRPAREVSSDLTGLSGIQDLLIRESLSSKVAVSPDHRARLRSLVNLEDNDMRAASEKGAAALKSVARVKLREILSNEQIRMMRIALLREKFPGPHFILDSSYMSEFGVSAADTSAAKVRVEEPLKIYLEEFTDLIKAKIAELMRMIPPAAREKFRLFFGPIVAYEKAVPTPDPKSITVLDDDRGARFLTSIGVWVFSKEMALSSEQKLAQNKLSEELFRMSTFRVKEVAEIHRLADEGVEELLMPEQHALILQSLHEIEMRMNFRILKEKVVLKYLSLPKEIEQEYATAVDRMYEDIEAFKSAFDKQLFDITISKFPTVQREKLTELFEGVW